MDRQEPERVRLQSLQQKSFFIYVDTGAMYRTIALGLLHAGTDIEDAAALEKQLSDIEVTISYENGCSRCF